MIAALAAELAASAHASIASRFRELAGRVRAKTGQKGPRAVSSDPDRR